jgi:type I restriction enzyme S subunit
VRPPIAEQRLIAVDLDRRRHRVEETAGIIEHQITLLMERRQALITAAVTGQIEIPGVAA